jgi:hypothetical protein
MEPIRIISLTPDLSRVLRAARRSKPFQRFANDLAQAVETAHSSLGLGHTWLKPGVNDIAIFLAGHSL